MNYLNNVEHDFLPVSVSLAEEWATKMKPYMEGLLTPTIFAHNLAADVDKVLRPALQAARTDAIIREMESKTKPYARIDLANNCIHCGLQRILCILDLAREAVDNR